MEHTNNDPIEAFKKERSDAVASYKDIPSLNEASHQWLIEAFRHKYMYNFAWTGRPIIQLPADILAFQEIVWSVRPNLIIETGIAHGGSLMLSASMLALLDYCDAIEKKTLLDPQKPSRRVLGIDIDIRSHNRAAIQQHPLSNRIDMIEGSSVSEEVISRVEQVASGYSKVLVCLDSNHTHDHVLKELELYGPMVSKGSYMVAFDTIIEDLPNDMFPDRPWEHGNNSKTAVHAYLKSLKTPDVQFEIDHSIQDKLLVSAMPDGLLKRV